MSNKTDTGMTMSADTEAMLLAVKARIAAVPAGETLINDITDSEWMDEDVGCWMVNVGSDESGNSDELDASDKETVKVA